MRPLWEIFVWSDDVTVTVVLLSLALLFCARSQNFDGSGMSLLLPLFFAPVRRTFHSAEPGPCRRAHAQAAAQYIK